MENPPFGESIVYSEYVFFLAPLQQIQDNGDL